MCSALVESFYKISTVVDTWNMPVSIDVESFYKISTVVDYWDFNCIHQVESFYKISTVVDQRIQDAHPRRILL